MNTIESQGGVSDPSVAIRSYQALGLLDTDATVIHSPLLGEYAFDDSNPYNRTVRDVLRTPVALRSLDINQVSASSKDAPFPGVAYWSRFFHVTDMARLNFVWGEYVGASEVDRLRYTIEESTNDFLHGPESHVADVAVEGTGGGEQWHDGRALEGKRLGGIAAALAMNGYVAAEQVLPPWVAASSPQLSTDQLQYVSAEGALIFDCGGQRSNELVSFLRELVNPEAGLLTIKDQHFVFSDAEAAARFGRLNMFLGLEHWGSVPKRVQFLFKVARLQHCIVNRSLAWMREVDGGVDYSPLSYLYGVDQDYDRATDDVRRQEDAYLPRVEALLNELGYETWQRFRNHREAFAAFILDGGEEYPMFARTSDYITACPRKQGQDDLAGEKDFTLKPLKYRYQDPLVKLGRQAVLPTTADEQYCRLLKQHRAAVTTTYDVSLNKPILDMDMLAEVGVRGSADDRPALYRAGLEAAEAFAKARRSRPEMPEHSVQRSIEFAAERALYYASHTYQSPRTSAKNCGSN